MKVVAFVFSFVLYVATTVAEIGDLDRKSTGNESVVRLAQAPKFGSGGRRASERPGPRPGVAAGWGGNGGNGFTPSGDLTVVTTFESAGLYLDAAGTGDCDADPGGCDEVTVQYREAGTPTWLDGHDMVYGSGGWEEKYKGSIVLLDPGTDYEVLVTRGGAEEHFQTFSTWKETDDWGVGQTTTLPSGTITETVVVDTWAPKTTITWLMAVIQP